MTNNFAKGVVKGPNPMIHWRMKKNDNNKTNTHKKQQMIQKCAKTYRF